VILDAGAFLAAERNDRELMALVQAAYDEGEDLKTHPMVVAQVWRGGRGRQAMLARLLSSVEVLPIDDGIGRRCGELLGKAGTSDPIDAAVVLIAGEGEVILTSDDEDLKKLARAHKVRVRIVHC
jgi:predicted nucleic acid-binding protein